VELVAALAYMMALDVGRNRVRREILALAPAESELHRRNLAIKTTFRSDDTEDVDKWSQRTTGYWSLWRAAHCAAGGLSMAALHMLLPDESNITAFTTGLPILFAFIFVVRNVVRKTDLDLAVAKAEYASAAHALSQA